MAKKIKDETGKTYVEKKPFYKKWWFWLIVAVFVFAMFGSSEEEPKVKEEAKTEQSSTIDNKTFKVGQTIEYNGLDMKVDEVKFLPQSDAGDMIASDENYVAVKVTIKNNNDDKVDYNQFDFQLYADGNETDFDSFCGNDSIDNDMMDSGSLNKGASVSKWLVGKAKKDAKEVKLVYTGNMFDDETKVSVNLK